MDDLCDSLDTIKQAEKQTEDIDKVLETGGFRVIPHSSKDRHSKLWLIGQNWDQELPE